MKYGTEKVADDKHREIDWLPEKEGEVPAEESVRM